MPETTKLVDIVADFTSIDAGFWVRAAQRRARAYCGWHIAPSLTLTGTLNTTGGRILRLPAKKLTNLVSLTDRWGNDLLREVVWSEDGLLEFTSGRTPVGVAALRYEMEAGYELDDVSDVVSVIIQSSRRAMNAPAGTVKSQSVNGASVSYAFGEDGPASVRMLQSEYEILDFYKLEALP